MNTEGKIALIHKIVFEILCDIDDFCKENNIQYFLSGGSCLGAVRHQGFIPWDDDADLMMPRDDYMRFLELFSKEYSHKYGIGALSIDPGWNRQWAKVWDLHTKLSYKRFENHDIGVFVDIYPIDGLPKTALARKAFYFHQKVLLELSKEADRKEFSEKNHYIMLRRFIHPFAKRIGTRRFVSQIDKMGQKYKFKDCKYVACSMPVHYGERETILRECVEEAVYLPFESRTLPIPKGYKTYLKNLYGDYMQIPKESAEKGYTHFDHWDVEFQQKG